MSNYSVDDTIAEDGVFVAQRLLKPDPSINSELDLFFRVDGLGGYDSDKEVFFATAGSKLSFDSYFNAFPLHRFDLLGSAPIAVTLSGTGRCAVSVYIARATRSSDVVCTRRIDFGQGGRERFVVTKPDISGVMFVSITALSDLEISALDCEIVAKPRNDVSIAAVITTFKRDAAVQKTARRLEAYFSENRDIADRFKLIVVDNGGDTDSVPFPSARVLKNPNYGGAGGFSRGLLETAAENLASHCLFMDDDASFFPESIRRTLAVLSYSNAPDLAIAGALITQNKRWMMWENGATFNKGCKPIDSGRDLRIFDEVTLVALAPQTRMANKYGGWWYFCFPVNKVKVWPFPFFVRGDDVNFSLANDFDIKTILGVASHQEDFFVKQTPMTVYLDMRSHFAHHLMIDRLRGGLWDDVKLFAKFFYRFNAGYHYESARSVILAIEDLMSGQDFWVDNLDMSEKRKQISSYTKNEKISRDIEYDPNAVAMAFRPRKRTMLAGLLQDLSLNGHLIPRFFFYTKGRALSLGERNNLSSIFLRPFVLRYDFEQGEGYLVRRDIRAFFANMAAFAKVVAKYALKHRRIKADYQKMHPELASKTFWEGKGHTLHSKPAGERAAL